MDGRAVALIVGRDPAALDEAGVARAAIESLAENFSDGVVAPIFWTALGGLPGGALYKAINTADSMIGHRTPRYRAFGWAAARLDDLVNLPASRLAALWLVLAAALTRGASARAAVARRLARRSAPPLAQRRLARGRDRRRARPEARRAARLWRRYASTTPSWATARREAAPPTSFARSRLYRACLRRPGAGARRGAARSSRELEEPVEVEMRGARCARELVERRSTVAS